MRTELVAVQVGACPEFVNVSSPLHQWQRFVPTIASRMYEMLKGRRIFALADRRTQGNHLSHRSELGRSPRSTTLLEIHPNADFAESGLSSSLLCALQTAIALILAIVRRWSQSPFVESPPPLTMIQLLKTTLDHPNTCHPRPVSRHRTQSRPLLDRLREYLCIVSISEWRP